MRLPVPGVEDVQYGVNLPVLIFLNTMSISRGVSVASIVYIHARIMLFHSGL